MGKKTNVVDELIGAIHEGAAILRGETPAARVHPALPPVDVRAIRRGFGLSQDAFAQRFGFGVSSVRDWEQGRARPDRATRSYLLVIQREPEAVDRALHQAA